MRFLRGPLGGILLSIFGVGVAAFLVFYLIPEAGEMRLPLNSVTGEWFTLHYPDDALIAANPGDYADYLESAFIDLMNRVGIHRADIPSRINIFVHNDVSSLARIVAQRRSPGMRIYHSPVDLIYGEDPRGAFIQLIGDHTGGRNHSSLLRHGIILYLLNPIDDHHLSAAALPASLRLSLSDLIQLERFGRFPPTRYEIFNSPFSAAGFSGLTGIANFFRLFRAEAQVEHDWQILVASFVSFLVEQPGGFDRVMELWRAGSFEANLKQVYGYGVDTLNTRWEQTLADRGAADEGWKLARGRGLIRVGRLMEAMALLAEEETGEAALERGRIYLLWGEWKRARTNFREAVDAGVDTHYYLKLLDIYDGWTTVGLDRVRVHFAPEMIATDQTTAPVITDVQTHLSLIVTSLETMKERLDITDVSFPDEIIIFYGITDQEGINSDHQMGALTLSTPTELRYLLAEYVTFHIWRDRSLSALLRRGLVRYLSNLGTDYFQHIREIIHHQEWIPLYKLDFANFPAYMVYPLAAGLVGYLLEEYGPEKLRHLWIITSPLGGRLSLDTAMSITYGFTRRSLEKRFTEW